MKTIIQSKKSFYRIILLIPIFFFTEKSYSQTWSDVGGGMCDWVNASVVYNNELVVGGRFTCAGGVPANHLAKWNGTSWSALGGGVDGWVNALTVYNGQLVAGGNFVNADGIQVNNIARWDGTSWTDVSGGTNSIVAALTVYNGQLIAGGYFTDAEGVPVNYIGAWDENGWYTLGTGMGGSQGQVMALDVYGTDLIAAGFFTTAGGIAADHIAKWDGTAWSTLGSGIAWITYSLGHYNSDLIAGGLFSTAGGVAANSIAKWDGTTWSPLGSGMGATPVGYNYVFALATYKGNLFAGGMYLTAGGVTANSIAKWNGTSWTDLNGGVQFGGSNVFAVNTLTAYGNDLYAAGIFTTAGSAGVAHIAKWNESSTALTLSVTGTNTGCTGNNIGSVNLTVSGGTQTYTYLWSNGAATEDISGLAAGTYTVTVTDAASVTGTDSFAVYATIGQGTYYADADGDGFGAGSAILACVQPANTSTNNTDCDDTNPAVFPGAAELCNGMDDNCNLQIDEGELCNDGNICTKDICKPVSGCWYSPDSCHTGIDENIGNQSSISLKAFPNLFSDKLNIEFTVAENSWITLEVFDINGQQIATLFNGNVKADKLQKVEYIPETVSRGIIIYRLNTGKRTCFGKAVIVR